METYPRAAVERAMKRQEVILRAVAKKITWTQAGEITGLCELTDAALERALGRVRLRRTFRSSLRNAHSLDYCRSGLAGRGA